VSAVVLLFIVYSKFDSSVGQTQQTMVTMGLLFCICSKNCFASFHVRWRHFRVGAGSINYFDDNERADFLNSRRKFVSQMALGLAAVPLLSLIYGITVGKYKL
jgi:hypothetical protein